MRIRYSPRALAELLGTNPPTEQQKRIIEAGPEPLLVVAGAGSGKTETMAARVVYLVANGLVRPEQILGLTFTRKAAGELTQRIRRRIGEFTAWSGPDETLVAEPTISTYDAYAGRLFAEHGLRAGYEPSTRLIDGAERWRIADAVVRQYTGDMSAVGSTPATVTAAVIALAGELAANLVGVGELREFLAALPELNKEPEVLRRAKLQLLPLIEEYQGKLDRAEEMDFAGQLGRAAQLAQDHPEVARTERARYRVVLLDEYQDTSHGQLVLLKALYGAGHSVTAVGDPCQAIYGWRGASAGTLERFGTDFPRADGEPAATAELTVSWRNQPGILAAANALSAPLGGSVALLEPGLPDRGQAPVRCALLRTEFDEAAWIAGQIDRAQRSYWDPAATAPPSMAVLVRRRAQMPAIEAALRAAGLEVEVVGLGGLLYVPEVVETVCVLRVLAEPLAGGALLRLLTGPRWRLGPRDVQALYARARELGGGAPSIVAALEDLGAEEAYSVEGLRRLTTFGRELRALRGRLDQPLPDLVADVIRAQGLDIEVAVRQRPTHLAEFTDVAARFASAAGGGHLTAFLAYLAAAESQERGFEPGPVAVAPGAVQLLTVHGAKGLEWDIVAVAGMNAKQFPATAKRSDAWLRGLDVLPFPLRGDRAGLPEFTTTEAAFDRQWAAHGEREERRLAYVAVTRAKDLLLCSGYWWSAERRTPLGPGGFLTQVKEYAAAGEWVADPGAENPLLETTRTATWPVDAADPALAAAAALVWAAEPVLTPEIELLLAERDLDLASTGVVALPDRLTVSQLVALSADPAGLARRLRRPLPERPATAARRGTAFHRWLERQGGTDALLDLDELPGAADADAAPDADFEELRAAFERSAWAGRAPYAVETPFATLVGGVLLRGRMDAVFRDADGTFEVVDWKTGGVPFGRRARDAAVQLAAYRLAWAELAGVPLAEVRAAFHYVRADVTVRPVDLLDAEGLSGLISSIPSLGVPPDSRE